MEQNSQQLTREQRLRRKNKDCSEKGFFRTYFVGSYLQHYADFSGITTRKEFWLAYLALCIVSSGVSGLAFLVMGLGGMTGIVVAAVISAAFSLGLLIPGLAISVRRLRDAGLSPWLMLLVLLPVIGQIALLIMFCRPSRNGHEEPETLFNFADGIVTVGCILLLGVGLWKGSDALASSLSADSYGFEDIENQEILEAEEIITPADDETIVVDPGEVVETTDYSDTVAYGEDAEAAAYEDYDDPYIMGD